MQFVDDRSVLTVQRTRTRMIRGVEEMPATGENRLKIKIQSRKIFETYSIISGKEILKIQSYKIWGQPVNLKTKCGRKIHLRKLMHDSVPPVPSKLYRL